MRFILILAVIASLFSFESEVHAGYEWPERAATADAGDRATTGAEPATRAVPGELVASAELFAAILTAGRYLGEVYRILRLPGGAGPHALDGRSEAMEGDRRAPRELPGPGPTIGPKTPPGQVGT